MKLVGSIVYENLLGALFMRIGWEPFLWKLVGSIVYENWLGALFKKIGWEHC